MGACSWCEVRLDEVRTSHDDALVDGVEEVSSGLGHIGRPQGRADELAGLGEGLSWERLDNRRASRLAVYHAVPSSPPLDENPQLASWAVEAMVRWNDVLRPIVAGLAPAVVPIPEADTTM